MSSEHLRKLIDLSQRHTPVLSDRLHRLTAASQLWTVLLDTATELTAGGNPFEIAADLPAKLGAVKGNQRTHGALD